MPRNYPCPAGQWVIDAHSRFASLLRGRVFCHTGCALATMVSMNAADDPRIDSTSSSRRLYSGSLALAISCDPTSGCSSNANFRSVSAHIQLIDSKQVLLPLKYGRWWPLQGIISGLTASFNTDKNLASCTGKC